MAKPKKQPAELSLLEQFALAPPQQHMAMLLWKNRHECPDMAVNVTEEDIRAFNDCMAYLKARPTVMTALRKRYVCIAMVEAGTEIKDEKTGELISMGNAIRPVENNERDHTIAQQAEQMRAIKQGARELATRLKIDAEGGTFSSAIMVEAARSLEALAT